MGMAPVRNAEEQRKWELKRAMDREKHNRKLQTKQGDTEAGQPVPRRKPRSAHLQQVKSQLYLPPSISVTNFSKLLGVRLVELQTKMEDAGFVHTQPDYTLTAEDASLIAGEFNFEAVVDDTNAFDLYARPVPADTSSLPLRAPLVTIMGHVDHGKTTLLDTLRKSSVAAQEAGGITQHIGAFSVKLPGHDKQITFLDTPGHAAFEAMRQRGASVTDIVVLVVAADDSVMPQTKEAIKHAQGAGVAMIVAVNKIDKPGADPEKVKRDLLSHGIEVEDFGGDVQAVAVSGLTGKGLDDLETAILSQAEVMDIRADPQGEPEAWVIESSVKRGRGAVASLIVRCGTLKQGSIIVAGSTWCRIRAMSDEAGKSLKEALPGTPVEVTGWSTLPAAGDEVLGASSEKEAKQVVANRLLRQEQLQQLKDIEAINEKRLKEREEALQVAQADEQGTGSVQLNDAASSKKGRIEVPLIIKADVSGSVEAIYDSVAFLGNDEVATKIVDKQVGEVSESDILRAAASGGKIIAFNVAVDKKTEALAARQGVEILRERVIYRLIDAVRDRLAEHLKPLEEQRVLGEAEILKLFQITTKGRETTTIAGCRITNGTLDRARKYRILRNKKTIWEGDLKMLKHVKQEVATLGKGNECGLQFEAFEALEVGDAIQCFSIELIKRSL
jgi:translation initiation factor IF-2